MNVGVSFIFGLLTKREVKMDIGYSFFACLWTETESRSINTQKKNEANIQPSCPKKLGQYRIYYLAFVEIFLTGHGG